ncbi:MAG: hypothetical protein IKE28_02295 [Solobacterium sp.]|nr:hypothetical protein [Solobacterium sp.]
MENIEIIKAKLNELGEDYDSLKPFMQKWLLKVEEAIQQQELQQKEALEKLKTADYSVKTIAESVGASRTTMYNHQQLLKRYIEHSYQASVSSSPFSAISKLQEDKSLLQEQLSKMIERDVDVELLKMENVSLVNTLEGKNAEIKRLEARVSELSEENHRLKASNTAIPNKPFMKKS